MEKTPVMLLQEVSIRLGFVPLYILISSNDTSHVNVFTYKVTVNGESATGTAFNKKQAKHKAAAEMLKKMLDTNSTISSELSSNVIEQIEATVAPVLPAPSTSFQETPSFFNNVGMLQEYCMKHTLLPPVYTIVDVTESMIPLFKATCVVKSISEEAIANNKKQAKQEAAKKVLDKIQSENNSLSIAQRRLDVGICSNLEIVDVDLANQMANLRIDHSEITKKAISYYENNASRIKNFQDTKTTFSLADCHTILKQEYAKEFPDTIKDDIKCLITKHIHLQEDCTYLVNYVTKMFGNLMERIVLPTVKKDLFMVGFRVSIFFPILTIGVGSSEKEAEKEAVINMLHTMERIMA